MLICPFFSKYHNQPDNYSKALDYLNIVFTAIFALECVLKLLAFRLRVSRQRICFYADEFSFFFCFVELFQRSIELL